MTIPDHLKDIKESLDKSSSINRNLGLVFTSYLVYVLIIVVSTTDYQLLVPNEGIKLPILDIELPLFGFYIVAPALVLILHLNLLFSLLKHSERLLAWQQEIAKYRDTEKDSSSIDGSLLLSPFLFNYANSLKPGEFSYLLIRGLISVSSFLFPLLLLVYVQVRFSDYHSLGMTGYHFGLVCLDGLFLMNYQYRILRPAESKGKNFWRMNRELGFLGWSPAFQWTLSKQWPFVSPKKQRPYSEMLGRGFVVISFWLGMTVLGGGNLWLITQITQESKPGFSEVKGRWWFPRLIVQNQIIVKDGPSKSIVVQQEKEGIEPDATWLKYATPLNLSRRNLSYANFDESLLYGVNFEKSKMLSVSFLGVHMQGANLSYADLQEAFIYAAKCQTANFFPTNLRGAIISLSNFNGAYLPHVTFNNVRITRTSFQGANLSNAEFQGANLTDSNLQFSDLREAEFNGGFFYGNNFYGAALKDNLLDSAYFGASRNGFFEQETERLTNNLAAFSKDEAFIWKHEFDIRKEVSSISVDELPQDTQGLIQYRSALACEKEDDLHRVFVPLYSDYISGENPIAKNINQSIRDQILENCPEKLEGVDMSRFIGD